MLLCYSVMFHKHAIETMTLDFMRMSSAFMCSVLMRWRAGFKLPITLKCQVIVTKSCACVYSAKTTQTNKPHKHNLFHFTKSQRRILYRTADFFPSKSARKNRREFNCLQCFHQKMRRCSREQTTATHGGIEV